MRTMLDRPLTLEGVRRETGRPHKSFGLEGKAYPQWLWSLVLRIEDDIEYMVSRRKAEGLDYESRQEADERFLTDLLRLQIMAFKLDK